MMNTMKRLLAPVFLAVVLLALAPGAAWAATDEPEVVLQGQDNGVAVALQLPAGPADDTRALQVSLRVAVESGTLDDVGFDFAAALGANVKEARYHADQNLLTLYLAGGQNLFANPTINLGSVVPINPGENGVRLAVSVVPSSLSVVNGAHSESAPSFYANPDPVVVAVGGSGVSPEPPNPNPDPDPNPNPNPNPGSEPAVPGPDSTPGPQVTPAGDSAGETPVLLSTADDGSLTSTGDGALATVLVLGACAIVAGSVAFVAIKRRPCTNK